MINKLLVTLSSLLLIFTLTGCHGSKGKKEFVVPEEFDLSKEYEIVFWLKNDTNINQVNIYNKAVADFEKLYPNIKIKTKQYTDYNVIYNDVITNISTNTTPNVCISYQDHIATYITGQNVVAPLDELISNSKYGLGGSELKYDSPNSKEIINKYFEELIIGEKLYGIPYMRSTEALYLNKTYIESMGYQIPEILTWDYVFEIASKAMEKNEDGTFKVNGQTTMIPFIYKSTDNMMIQMMEQVGGDYSNKDGDILLFNDTAKEMLEMIKKNCLDRSFSTFKISSYPGNMFNAGQCIIAVDSTAGATWMGSHAPLLDIHESQVVEFETAVRMVPQFDIDNPKMISQGPSICIFNKEDPQEVLASWLFAQFLLTNDVQVAYSKTEGYVPVTLKAQNSVEYQEYINSTVNDSEHYDVKLGAAKILIDNVDNTFITPVFNGSTSLRNAAGQLVENVAKSVLRKETIDDSYYKKMYEDTISLYHLNGLGAEESGFNRDLGPLPTTSKLLLGGIGLVWIIIGAVYFKQLIKNKNK